MHLCLGTLLYGVVERDGGGLKVLIEADDRSIADHLFARDNFRAVDFDSVDVLVNSIACSGRKCGLG